ncbi:MULTISPECIES: biotin-dependent carboxyltransferase family protein [Tatumella]|uniref:Biotin-dependent carboxyltransferase family protein n=1 Tax=Tatumella punctata TaxID=399969 RepID=A0ABW1VK70_9GAMM|nr:biotin-dependent carboxyltransferase [Tatumella sp. JGM16]MBS0893981.1 biotin-dependent carboxyltransferase [Tatumella sp. JGM130]MBS0913171.1 biotin-dependent carboxyltransferase [Tatumella sp. JGM91]
MAIEILHPGLATALHDSGRYGWQHFGVPISGAMDLFSHQLANRLAGNSDDPATLEMTLQGARLHFLRRAVIVLTGADLSPMLDGEPVEMLRPLTVPAGAVLSFGARRRGARCYLAIKGGFAAPEIMGSQSTCSGSAFGGYGGRYLKKGDRLAFRWPLHNISRSLAPFGLPDIFPQPLQVLRFIPGKHWDRLTGEAKQRFTDSVFTVSPYSDRMGYRLQGEALTLSQPADIYSEAVSRGTVQLPADGLPIILLADSQTTGGYPKIAHIATMDLPYLAQALPGAQFCFRQISLHTAQQLAYQRQQWLEKIPCG